MVVRSHLFIVALVVCVGIFLQPARAAGVVPATPVAGDTWANATCAACEARESGCYPIPCSHYGVPGFAVYGHCLVNNVCIAVSVDALAAGPAGGVAGSLGVSLSSLTDLLGAVQLVTGLLGGTPLSGSNYSGGSLSDLYPACVQNPITGGLSPIPCLKEDGTIAYSSGFSGLDQGTIGGTVTPGVGNTLLDLLGSSTPIGFIDNTSSSNQQSPSNQLVSDLLQSLSSGSALPSSGGSGTSNVPSDKTSVSSLPRGNATGTVSVNPRQDGNIKVTESGATVVAEGVDASGSGVAGFYGAGAGSLLQAQSLVGRLCTSRPWQSGFLAAIIDPSFFDGICEWGGYNKLPTAPQQNNSPRVQIVQQPTVRPTTTPTAPTIRPEADIWANPPSVRLGTRTSIYWTSRGVASCDVRGPSFEQRNLSGVASTVPLSDASVFTIQCTTADGSVTVEDRVTVYLAI